jgi:isochorismate pyruvate lyase
MTMKQDNAETAGASAGECCTMVEIRREIDRVDRALVRMMAERLTYIERAGIIKKDRNVVRDEARIQDVLDKLAQSCTREAFPFKIAAPVWRALMEGCIAHEFDVWDEANPTPSPKRRAQG